MADRPSTNATMKMAFSSRSENSVLMIRRVDKPFGESQCGLDLLEAFCAWTKRPFVFSYQKPIELPPSICGADVNKPVFIKPPRMPGPSERSGTKGQKSYLYLTRTLHLIRYLKRWIALVSKVPPASVGIVVRNHLPGRNEPYPERYLGNGRTLLFIHTMPDFHGEREDQYSLAEVEGFMRNAAGLVFVSNHARDRWDKAVNLEGQRTYVLNNSCREGAITTLRAQEKERLREKLGITKDCTIFINVATLGQRKGQLELLQTIVQETKFLHARCKFIFVGYEQHSYGDTLRAFVSANGLDDLVRILGPKQNALEYIRASDFTVLSSKSESFGRTLLESQALATPAISTRVGIAEELIDHGVNGYLLHELPSKKAAQVLLKACSMSEPEYSAMSISSLDKYEAGFSKTHYIKAFNEIMNDFKASVENAN